MQIDIKIQAQEQTITQLRGLFLSVEIPLEQMALLLKMRPLSFKIIDRSERLKPFMKIK